MPDYLDCLEHWDISVWENACTHLNITQPVQVQVSIRAVALHGDDLQVTTKVASIEPADGQAIPVPCQHGRPVLIVLHNAVHAAAPSDTTDTSCRRHVLQDDCKRTQDTDAQENAQEDSCLTIGHLVLPTLQALRLLDGTYRGQQAFNRYGVLLVA